MSNQFIITEIWWSLLGLSVIYWFGLRKQRSDRLRYKLRSIRDELFDEMWRNKYDFNLQEYRDTRQMLNGMIKMSNSTGPIHVIAIFFRVHTASIESQAELMVNPELEQLLECATGKAMQAWLRFCYLEGLVGLLLRTLFRAFDTYRSVAKLKRRFNESLEGFEQTALRIGNEEYTLPC